MGYSVDLELDHLPCRSRAACLAAVAAINGDAWMKQHMAASASTGTAPAQWRVTFDSFDGCDWNEPVARRVWLAVAPYMADGAKLEFREEGGLRYRVAWMAGRAYEERPVAIVWAAAEEITKANL